MNLLITRLHLIFLVTVLMSTGIMHAYTPITWITGNPNNVFAPLCLSNIHSNKKSCSPWQKHLHTNLFGGAQSNMYGRRIDQVYGVALQGHMHMDPLLRGLYTQVYVPAILTYGETYNWDKTTMRNIYRHGSTAAIADLPFVLGWNAIRRKSFRVSGYGFGIIPTTKFAFYHHRTKELLLSFDNHFACGLGGEVFVRICGTPRHHVDWLTEADVTFQECRKGIGTLTSWDYRTIKPIPIKIQATQLYKIRSGIAYKFRHFISDIGAQYLYTPERKYSLTGDALTVNNVTMNYDPSTHLLDLFADIGWVIGSHEPSPYVVVGTHMAIAGYNSCSDWDIHLKLGIDF